MASEKTIKRRERAYLQYADLYSFNKYTNDEIFKKIATSFKIREATVYRWFEEGKWQERYITDLKLREAMKHKADIQAKKELKSDFVNYIKVKFDDLKNCNVKEPEDNKEWCNTLKTFSDILNSPVFQIDESESVKKYDVTLHEEKVADEKVQELADIFKQLSEADTDCGDGAGEDDITI